MARTTTADEQVAALVVERVRARGGDVLAELDLAEALGGPENGPNLRNLPRGLRRAIRAAATT